MASDDKFERLDPQKNVLASAAHAIGNTPLVELSRLVGHFGVRGRILAKLEYLNPGLSKKDRPALQMILDARENGQLKPGQTVVELTSGNTGTGLAIVCAALGHPFLAVISKGNSMERVRMMRALGARVVRVDQLPDSKPGEVSGQDLALVEEEAQRLTKELGAFRADQFNLPGIVEVHLITTGPEILAQSGGRIDVFCDFLGSGSSFAGLARFFRAEELDIACYLIEPEGAAILAGEPVTNPGHKIQGGGYAMQGLMSMEGLVPDGFLTVSDARAIVCARALAKTEGIFAGFSSGANIAGALELLAGDHEGQTVLVIICDSGLKYLSTDLWE